MDSTKFNSLIEKFDWNFKRIAQKDYFKYCLFFVNIKIVKIEFNKLNFTKLLKLRRHQKEFYLTKINKSDSKNM